jgi:hypothetical protein
LPEADHSLDLSTVKSTGRAKRQPKPKDDFGSKVKAHQRYYTSDGEMVPGATTVLNVIAKPYLVTWANRLGLEGVDTNKYKDEAAAIGTLAHYLVECELRGEEPDLKDYTPAQVERAAHSRASYQEWKAQEVRDMETIGVEMRLVSDEFRYGGTLDWYGRLNGLYTLVDYKTSASVYPEHKAQTASYARLLQEHKMRIQAVILVRLGRTEGDSYEQHRFTGAQLKLYWEMFEAALRLYAIQKRMRKSK